MIKRKTLSFVLSGAALSLGLAFGACGKKAEDKPAAPPVAEAPPAEAPPAEAPPAEAPPAEAPKEVAAVAVLQPASGSSVNGTVTFLEKDGKVTIKATVSGLSATHGFHIHEKGDCSAPDATSAGGHFNPAGHDHAGPDAEKRHAGDLGNLVASEEGVANHTAESNMITLGDAPNGIIGKAVIVHANADDLKTQPTGNAGGRVACGVITAK